MFFEPEVEENELELPENMYGETFATVRRRVLGLSHGMWLKFDAGHTNAWSQSIFGMDEMQFFNRERI